METLLGIYIGATIGIHSPFPTKHQTVIKSHLPSLRGFDKTALPLAEVLRRTCYRVRGQIQSSHGAALEGPG